jgi:hypothetical protein
MIFIATTNSARILSLEAKFDLSDQEPKKHYLISFQDLLSTQKTGCLLLSSSSSRFLLPPKQLQHSSWMIPTPQKNYMHLNECQTFDMYNDAILSFFTYLGTRPDLPDSMPHQPQQ